MLKTKEMAFKLNHSVIMLDSNFLFLLDKIFKFMLLEVQVISSSFLSFIKFSVLNFFLNDSNVTEISVFFLSRMSAVV